MINWQEKLAAIYGEATDDQITRYQDLVDAFEARFGAGPVTIYRVPGRVNLIGEHTDYQQGYVLPAALDKDILFAARDRPDDRIRLQNIEDRFEPHVFQGSTEIPAEERGNWSNYARGAAQMIWQQAQGRTLTGMDVLVSSRLPHGIPRGAGLSSSSALTVGIAWVLADLNTLDLSRAELAWLCGEAEWYVGTRGGIMDQFIVLLAQRDHALFLDCRAQGEGPNGLPRFRTEKVPLPDNYSLLVTDSQVRHQNTRGHFNVRVAEDRIGVALLQRHFPGVEYLRDLEPYPWAELEPLLPEKVDWDDLQKLGISLETLIDVELPRDAAPFMVRRRCRHVITENARVLESVEALRRDDIERFGELLNAAHTSVSKDYGASCKELDLLVKLARQVDGVIGTRMTGAGWGGCTITLCQQGAENAFINHVRPAYHEETGLWPDIFVCHAGPGAGLVAADEIS